MNPKFRVSDRFGSLEVEMDGEKEELITVRFLTRENKNKATEYLRNVAAKLNELYQSDPDAAGKLLEEAEDKVRKAQLAEKFLEEVKF